MGKSIYDKQQDPLIIQCLFAQRNKYTQAKRLSAVYFFICGILAVVFLVLKAITGNHVVQGVSIGISIASIFLKDTFTRMISSLKDTAAGIQQYIDTTLFSRNDNNLTQYTWKCPFGKDDIIEKVSIYPQSGFNENDRWYEDYSKEAFCRQIVLCQKESIRWDRKLRKKFLVSLYFIIISVVLLILIFGITLNQSVLGYLSTISWCLPFIRMLYECKKALKEDEVRLNGLTNTVNNLLNNYGMVLTEDELIENEKELQDRIYEHRRRAFLIPNFFYKLFRSKQQKEEQAIAANYKGEYANDTRDSKSN